MSVLPANQIRIGQVINLNDALQVVVKTPEHTKPGKGPAYIQLELKNIITGTKTNVRINSNNTVEKVFLEQKSYQFLYREGDDINLMDSESFEQILIHSNLLEGKDKFLEDGMSITIFLYNNKPIMAKLPDTVIVEIAETQPRIKGSTVTASYKPATLENGYVVSVPPYLSSGEKIVIKTVDLSFVERVK